MPDYYDLKCTVRVHPATKQVVSLGELVFVASDGCSQSESISALLRKAQQLPAVPPGYQRIKSVFNSNEDGSHISFVLIDDPLREGPEPAEPEPMVAYEAK